jgi:hypothetical protein
MVGNLLEGVQSLRCGREKCLRLSCERSEFNRYHVPTNKPAAHRVDGAELSGQRRGVHCSVAIIASYIDVTVPAPSLNRTDVSSIVQLREEFFTKDRLSHHAYRLHYFRQMIPNHHGLMVACTCNKENAP